ncbi:MAG TPA: bifunctional adenosylcobinamide kinase/adenosylcobinamide-phosphate guanylyltransferase [Actinomycetota bacterium]|nr:bifunctional adenosylcobinamide kinase/adenosylcobinamide-phosphate guanylyltransferase [Actinomycetota bacterium]
MTMTLIVGGARAGKSALALEIARKWGGPVTFVATAEARDEEMTERIARHRAERDDSWATLEEPIDLAASIATIPPDHLIVLDCLTLWASNVMDRDIRDGEVRARQISLALASRAAPTLVITNEVGSGIVPDNAAARAYRDLLGALNSIFASDARDVLMVVAGRAISMKKPEEVIDDVLDR